MDQGNAYQARNQNWCQKIGSSAYGLHICPQLSVYRTVISGESFLVIWEVAFPLTTEIGTVFKAYSRLCLPPALAQENTFLGSVKEGFGGEKY